MGHALIDIRKLKELVKLMVENDLSELDLRDEAETVVVKRTLAGQYQYAPAPPGHSPYPGAMMPAPGQRPTPLPADDNADTDDEASLHAIVSPMVGTFYTAPDPESPAYVKVGSDVDPDSVVCIVEAMKVFSEIKAECSGTIEKLLVKNGDAVEYGQKLFLVRTR